MVLDHERQPGLPNQGSFPLVVLARETIDVLGLADVVCHELRTRVTACHARSGPDALTEIVHRGHNQRLAITRRTELRILRGRAFLRVERQVVSDEVRLSPSVDLLLREDAHIELCARDRLPISVMLSPPPCIEPRVIEFPKDRVSIQSKECIDMGVLEAAASSRSAVTNGLRVVEPILKHPCPHVHFVSPAVSGAQHSVDALPAHDPRPDDAEKITSRLDAATSSSLASWPLVGNYRGQAVSQGVIEEGPSPGDLSIVLEEHGALCVVPCSARLIFVHRDTEGRIRIWAFRS